MPRVLLSNCVLTRIAFCEVRLHLSPVGSVARAMMAWRFECDGEDLQAQNGATALHGAAANGHADVVRELLLRGCDADVQNSNCSTALHLAASKGVDQCCSIVRCRSGSRKDLANAGDCRVLPRMRLLTGSELRTCIRTTS